MTLRIGTRGSALALAQSRWVAARLGVVVGEMPELVIVRTTGDRDQTSELASFGGAGAFTTEIDRQQRAGLFEISVHSLKDLPTEGREGLVLAGVPARAPVADCLVSREGVGLDGLAAGAVVGTGSARRSAQLRRLRPDLVVTGIRGNVGTRIEHVRAGRVEATLLARAGLVRLGLVDEAAETLTLEQMIPAAGQGALAIVVNEGADEAWSAVARMDDPATRAEVTAERATLAALGGGCHLPMGVLGRERDGSLTLRARVVSLDGKRTIEEHAEGPSEAAATIGAELGQRLRDAGASELLEMA